MSACLTICSLAYLKTRVQISLFYVRVKTVNYAAIRSFSDDNKAYSTLGTCSFVDDIMFSYRPNDANEESIKLLCFVEFARWRHLG